MKWGVLQHCFFFKYETYHDDIGLLQYVRLYSHSHANTTHSHMLVYANTASLPLPFCLIFFSVLIFKQIRKLNG